MEKYLNLNFWKTPKFYVSAVGVILGLLAAIFYVGLSSNTEVTSTMNPTVLVIAIIALVVYAALMIIKPLEYYSSFISWCLIFISFIVYVFAVYNYFPGVFYNGFSMEALFGMDKGVLLSVFFFIFALIIGNVGIYLPGAVKKEKKEQEVTTTIKEDK